MKMKMLFYRIVYNGPVGRWDFDKGTAKQWFDGMSFLQSFTLDRNGSDVMVRMRKRFLRSDALRKAEAAGR